MRYFKLVTHLTMPRSLMPGIGNTHERPEPGHVVAISEEACARESRFVNGRMRAGDMKETTETEYAAHVKACELAALEAQTEAAPVEPAPAPAAKSAKGK